MLLILDQVLVTTLHLVVTQLEVEVVNYYPLLLLLPLEAIVVVGSYPLLLLFVAEIGLLFTLQPP